jgi:hypothetical protein
MSLQLFTCQTISAFFPPGDGKVKKQLTIRPVLLTRQVLYGF